MRADDIRARSGILVVSARTGTGHLRAAEALVEAAAEAHPGVRVTHVELLEVAPRWVRACYGAGYEWMAARAPRAWSGIYRLTDGDGGDRARWAPLARRLLFREFARLVGAGWDACVCTHFLPAQLAGRLRGAPPISVVMTDFTVHRFWAQPAIARYFVPTGAAAAELRRRLPRARVEASGIPISAAVGKAPSRAAARATLGLDTRPVLLLTGGGLGIGVEAAVDAALAGTREEVQLVAVCGRGEAARGRLEARGLPPSRLRVLGYARDLERWMAAADVVAGKAGGLFTSEALALGKPLVLTRPIPGAEEGNTAAVVREGAALAGRGFGEMRDAFARAFAEPALLARLAENARRLGRPHAARTVIDAVLRESAVGAAA
ncbi:MAG TPA: glycosyltransferase [Longimicrobium sp.]|nr:glycosyltransferase [Longimicrobium sp.]